MTTNKRTDAQITRALAERLGWRDLELHEGSPSGLLGWRGEYFLTVPDWLHDTNAALALCLDIARGRGWEVKVLPLPLKGVNTNNTGYDAAFVPFFGWEKSYIEHVFTTHADTPARALALLALKALAALEATNV